MDFMGIGPLEIILILVLGFLFFGPEKLPGMAAKAGKWYRNFTRAASSFSKALNEELQDEKKLGDSIESEVKSALEPPQQPSEQPENNTDKETDNNLNG